MNLSIPCSGLKKKSLTSEADRYTTANQIWQADNIQHYIDGEGTEDKLIVQVRGAHPKLENMRLLLYKQSEMAERDSSK